MTMKYKTFDNYVTTNCLAFNTAGTEVGGNERISVIIAVILSAGILSYLSSTKA